MSLTQRDLKLLWGRSGALCAICKAALAHDSEHATGTYHVGEQAHIVGEDDTSPRGNSVLTREQRETYANMLLLCPTCHTTVDKGDPASWPVERLHLVKTEHELWVQARLAVPDRRDEAAEQIYADLIDAAVVGGDLAHWQSWVSTAASPYQFWDASRPELIEKFRDQIVRAVWPGKHDELERALQTFAAVLQHAALSFLRHAEPVHGNRLGADRFYKIREFDAERYGQLASEFEAWQDLCHEWLFEATKAANWLADVVRKDLNPLFFALEGRFALKLDHGLHTTLYLPDYSESERRRRPTSVLRRIEKEQRAWHRV